MARAEAVACANRRVGCDEQGPDRSRIQVRGIDHLLRDDAGDRDGQRSPGGLRKVQGADESSKEVTLRNCVRLATFDEYEVAVAVVGGQDRFEVERFALARF